MNDLFLGLDVGTTNIKAAVFDLSGKQLAYASRPNVIHHPQPEYSEHDAEEIWQILAADIRDVTAKAGAEGIRGIAASSMAECGVLLDEGGHPLYPVIAWYDPRTAEEGKALETALGARQIYSITGQFLMPLYGICKMMWIKRHHPEIFAKGKHWLSMQDYVIYRLTGEFATDYTTAGRTLGFDINKLDWSPEMFAAAGIDPALMSPAYPGGTEVGKVSRGAAEETGLMEGTSVSTGGHDHCCAAVGVNIFEDGVVLNSMGTAETLMIAMDHPVLNDKTWKNGYCVYPHCGPKLYRALIPNASCGVAIEWMFRSFAKDLILRAEKNGRTKFEEMELESADRDGAGVFFYPFLRGIHDISGARGAFLGLRDTTDEGDMINAVVNGLCYETRRQLDHIGRTVNLSFDKFRVVGGVSKSAYIMQRKADISEWRVEVPVNREAACFGAAVLAAVGAGAAGFGEIGAIYRAAAVYEPQKDSVLAGENYERYRQYRRWLAKLPE